MLRPLLLTLMLLQASPSATAVAGLGDLDVAYDPARWRIAWFEGGLRFECASERCEQDPVIVRKIAWDARTCTPAGLSAQRSRNAVPLKTPVGRALTFHGLVEDLGCRNLVAPRVTACASHAGTVYSFESGPLTCQAGPSRSVEGVLELIDRTAPVRKPR